MQHLTMQAFKHRNAPMAEITDDEFDRTVAVRPQRGMELYEIRNRADAKNKEVELLSIPLRKEE